MDTEGPPPTYAWSQRARHMGQLTRGDTQWDVYLEIMPDEKSMIRGRMHFLQGDRHRESGWIFIEASDRDVLTRFNDFSAVELWRLVEAMTP